MSDYPYSIQVKMPRPDGAADDVEHECVAVAHAESFAIARHLAYSLARVGIPTRFPKPLDDEDKHVGWFDASPTKAKEMGEFHAQKVAAEAQADRLVIASRQMRARGRVGPMVGELVALAEETSSPEFRAHIRSALLCLGDAMAVNVYPKDPKELGVSWVKASDDILRGALEAWGVEAGCQQCAPGPMTAEELENALRELFAHNDAPPVPGPVEQMLVRLNDEPAA